MFPRGMNRTDVYIWSKKRTKTKFRRATQWHKVQAGSRTQCSRTRAAGDVGEDMGTSNREGGEDEDLETGRDVETFLVCDGGEGKDKEATRDVETVEAGVGGNLQVGQETCRD
ncbi:hypothetical protein AMECASPLE_021144 [Ameca splendens]|uniref:Uncharacterized protein n=1 Tax=Ameca splendens TaxID=208324 RepID=A0ABV0YRK9_9TELE